VAFKGAGRLEQTSVQRSEFGWYVYLFSVGVIGAVPV